MVKVRDRFSVYSPFVVPGRRGMAVSGFLLPRQVKAKARKLGMRHPLVWIACPPAVNAVDYIAPSGLVYQRTDRFEDYEGVDSDLIAGFDRRLKTGADLTLFCSRHLHESEHAALAGDSAFVDHGVDFEDFMAAGDAPDARDARAPAFVRDLPGPRVGFVGDIDSAVFDADLFLKVAALCPDLQFVLVGGCTLPEGWLGDLKNVRLNGRIPYGDVPGTMAAMDVLIMPWHRSEWIEACNPVKLKEYLATARPIVTTDFPELRHYEGLLAIENSPEGFAAAVTAAAQSPDEDRLRRGRERVSESSWTSRKDAVLAHLERVGLSLPHSLSNNFRL